MSRSPNGSIQSLERAMSVLEVLASARDGLQLSEVADRTDLNTSTVHHLLATFRGRGWVDQDERGKSYRIGSRLIGLVTDSLRNADIYTFSLDAIRSLRDETQETAYLTRCEGLDLVPGIEMLGLQPIQCRREVRPGQSVLHSTASGKILLAFLPEAVATQLLPSLPLTPFTPHTISTLPKLKEELRRVRTQGVALDHEENILGVSCIAAPVLDQFGSCVATVSIAYPSSRNGLAHQYLPPVLSAARQVSMRLGFAGSYPASSSVDLSGLVGNKAVAR